MVQKYFVYKIFNDDDDKIYIGSTSLILRKRMDAIRSECKKGGERPLFKHIRQIGVEKFHIELLHEIEGSKLEARQKEQEVINSLDNSILLNAIHAYSHNYNRTRNQDKKRANRRAYYNRKKEDPVWMEKERERNKLRMRIKRQII